MDADFGLNLVKLLRLVAFMVFVYLLFGLAVERFSRKPDSQLKAFAHIVCSPVTRPMARVLAPGTPHRSVLLRSLVAVAAVWAVLVAVQRAITGS